MAKISKQPLNKPEKLEDNYHRGLERRHNEVADQVNALSEGMIFGTYNNTDTTPTTTTASIGDFVAKKTQTETAVGGIKYVHKGWMYVNVGAGKAWKPMYILTENTAAPLASPTFTGTVTIPTPFTLGAVSVLPTGTELNYVDGVTSNIQTQLDAKAALAGSASQNFAINNATVAGTLAVTGQTTLSGQLNLAAGVNLDIIGSGTNPNKYFRTGTTGDLELVNSAYTAVPFSVSDGGNGLFTGTLSVTGAFGCNTKAPQTAYAVGAAATDLATVITLANNIRLALIANGIAS